MAAKTTARAPNGSKIVAKAFMAALEHYPDTTRGAIATAALAQLKETIAGAKVVGAKTRKPSVKSKAKRAIAKRPRASKSTAAQEQKAA